MDTRPQSVLERHTAEKEDRACAEPVSTRQSGLCHWRIEIIRRAENAVRIWRLGEKGCTDADHATEVHTSLLPSTKAPCNLLSFTLSHTQAIRMQEERDTGTHTHTHAQT